MFLNYLTCVDHAYIDDSGRVVGGSYHPNFLVGGKVDEVEQVVVDFSSVKKQIKDAVDDKETGFDHKLWIVPGYSRCEIDTKHDQMIIRTPACELEMPKNAVKILQNNFIGTFQETVQQAIQNHVWQALDKLHPQAEISVECQLTTRAFMKDPKKSFMFRYTHGLKNSTSWGCQNHSHGHLSWVEIEHDAFYSPDCNDCKRAMQTIYYDAILQIDGAILIFSQNIVEQTDSYIRIQYATERGVWKATYNKANNKLIVMDKETTIENIIDWIVDPYVGVLKEGHVKRIYISEGLSKGAVRELSV
jgi:6-pyruvoyl-tetrahydropterin synthase